MNDIDAHVDDVVFDEAEEQLMMDAEMEHLQREAEIALNTRAYGNELLPFFDNSNEALIDDPVDATIDVNHANEGHDVRTQGLNDNGANPFSVMSKRLWKTLREPMSNDLNGSDRDVGHRTSLVMFA